MRPRAPPRWPVYRGHDRRVFHRQHRQLHRPHDLLHGSASSGASGSPLAIFKESNVGSSNGVQPLYTYASGGASGLTFIIRPRSPTRCARARTAVRGRVGQPRGYTAHSSCPATAITTTAVPTAGSPTSKPPFSRPLPGAREHCVDTNYLSSFSTLDQVWALAMTKNAYYALQAARLCVAQRCTGECAVAVARTGGWLGQR